MNWKDKALTASVVIILICAGAFVLLPSAPKERLYKYAPTMDLPEDFMIFVEKPAGEDDMTFIAALSSLAVSDDDYHPMFIFDPAEGLDTHQLWTIEHMDIQDVPKLVFANSDGIVDKLRSQVGEIPDEDVFTPSNTVLGKFKGFNGYITVGSYKEALWVAPLAKIENKVIIMGKSTFSNQEQVWDVLFSMGHSSDYIVVTNPFDFDVATLEMNQPDYNNYDSQFHVDSLSVLAAELAAYREAYVITDCQPSGEEVYSYPAYKEDDPNFEEFLKYWKEIYKLNTRAIGTYLTIKNVSAMYGPAEYVCIVGSAAAVPQFQMPGVDGDVIVNSDVMFGFLDDDQYTMDAAVGRVINLNLQGASNQLAKIYAYEHLTNTVTVDYSDIAGGTQEINWPQHGASFSGYEITYERMQATPARWICEDYDDEGMDYEYVGPSGSGELIGDGVKNTDEQDLGTICEASGFVAYRGHGSDYGSLYSLRVYMPNSEEGVLSSEEARALDLPPQVAFFVSCMNAKIYGTGYGADADDVEYEKLFGVNYLYGGALAVGGATEVSYSNVGQDIDSLWARYGMGIFHDESFEWDLNDAWFAFFWDGLLNHEEEYGTVGKALQWAENRYIKYHDNQVSPFEWTDDSNLGGHWKEVSMFVIYSDPAFEPKLTITGDNSLDLWHNGPDDY
jgi:hypothetical protein